MLRLPTQVILYKWAINMRHRSSKKMYNLTLSISEQHSVIHAASLALTDVAQNSHTQSFLETAFQRW